ncbi:MAG: hypothetical protein A4E35_00427 [Methanoregula sp. PtaU1.Bin051]|nr:MAG: hypothetical protein A4E35_00427 [Methanoregula sp. PtaU1.Bin051]
MSLKEDLDRWENEKKLYRELESIIHSFLKDLSYSNGLAFKIETRLKEDYSFYKKMNLKRNENKDYSYNDMTDKFGVRIICRYKEEIPLICELIDKNFDVKKTEDFYEKHAFYEQGYKSIHKDVKLKETKKEFEKFKNLIFEIQIRTLCDNVWADIYHDIGYKPANVTSEPIKRELHCLGGLLEVADSCFSRVNQNILNSDEISSEFVLNYLLPYFYQLFKTSYDANYSKTNLDFLLTLIDIHTVKEFKQEIDDFIHKNRKKIEFISNERRGEISNPLITQPEVLLIFYLIEFDRAGLRDRWGDHFNYKYLEDLSTWWGDSI